MQSGHSMKILKSYTPPRVDKRARSVSEGAKILDVLSVAMVKNAVHGTNARKVAKAPDAVIILDVADPEWISPVTTAWGTVVMGSKGCTELEHDDSERVDPRGSWVHMTFRKKPSLGRTISRDTVLAMLRLGKPVVLITSDLSWVPAEFQKLATLRMSINAPTAEVIAEVAQDITGDWCVPQPFSAELAKRLTADDLLIAGTRGDVSAQAFLNRLANGVVAPVSVQGAPARLEDLHGAVDAVAWGLGLARDLADLKAGLISWADVDKGLLISGPPGCGKTTFARALATTCGVPLVSASYADWQAKGHLGDLLAEMKKAFAEARNCAPCILFLDEVDSFGDRGNTGNPQHARYDLQVVNALLASLDGAVGRDGVVVVGACNHPDMLDPALTRAGRLDRHIKLSLPDETAIAKIMRFHLRDDLTGDDLSRVARRGVGGTGADVEQWVRGARRRARHERRKVSLEDLVAEQGVSSTTLNAQDLTRMAFHEAGHVVAGWLARPENMVFATLYRAGGHGGYVRMRGGRENYVRADIEAELQILLAGRASEEVIYGEASSGAGGDGSSDLAMATRLALASLTSLGFGQRQQGNLVWLGAPGALDVEATLRGRPELANEVGAMLDNALASARMIIEANIERVEKVARHLLAYEYASGEQITAIMTQAVDKNVEVERKEAKRRALR